MICECVADHNPEPVRFHTHHVIPTSWGGPDTPANLVELCPTTHNNVHALLNLYRRNMGRPPWYDLRRFGPYTRGLAARAWAGWIASGNTGPPPWTAEVV